MSFIQTISQISRDKDLRKKILIILGILVISRFFAALPIPGTDPETLKSFFAQNQYLGLVNIFSGGAMANFSIAMLGIGPYITASIILQLLTMIFPAMKEMYYEQGELGRAKFVRYTRIMTVFLAFFQGFAFLNLLKKQGVVGTLDPFELFRNIILVTAGSIIFMWLGELISEQKIGSGSSLIIFAGIITGLPTSLRNNILTFDYSRVPSYLIFIALGLITILGVIYINESERRVPINYAKRVRGMKVFGGQNTYLPLKVNQAGVIPIIFAISLLLFPGLIGQILSLSKNAFLANVGAGLSGFLNNQLAYGISYFIFVFAFTYFYTLITFDPKEISKNLQRQGGFVPGIRPGQNTADHLSKILFRITFLGAMFLGVIAVLPLGVQAITGISSLTLGGTSLLIVVSVALETMRQFRAQMVMRDYETF
ncbi:MAG: preprotein translocase subunit SecY [Candidatus Brennerbacteria bacterium RIFOXYC1_FULL_41_11]|uniref:Protein translocase subunit SecY n=1 Tax=Candidatus Brennerbacteria bacterium RIFOXYD1_FULL_41_16 TaxID=1797529 RepID=A0A1G1XJT8_9BACT|nr:MAG: Protein translocase subunit SecY [Parcubacteria group bacterium GW2011_GWB1_41_4]OGY38776.1 MAG: preprotein translocase subunit SecY [Candidatus Brennerbacteria bacterium RIFOXYB1_FULL_41_13]OGY39059.1 MAG: preprotein translocase subunit SecY [Candidatus Brennerbacteria bacterium RIFOXYC1_FULL_41_11]OGY40212.1 MAG: preprotein translocase subunit SecY [Candidatus Brennerbacteria bacterium RIFOXYD1_FULL_41_16]